MVVHCALIAVSTLGGANSHVSAIDPKER